MTTKTCTSCRTEKQLSEFHRFGKDNAQIGKWCETCFQKKKKGNVNRNIQPSTAR